MAEAELHKERLQALAEKRKRQAEIEDKRRQLDELVLQLQHFKSKAMRERWLLQGTTGPQEEDDERRKKVEEDELHIKKLEDIIHRLESEISLLESEESQISAKEQVLREKLRETERSIEDLQKSLQNQDGDAVNYTCSQSPDFPELNSQSPISASADTQHPRKSALYAMEINVEKDRKTGTTKILSASAVSPHEAHQRGIKVFDDGRKVIYEVRSGGSATLENGVHSWSSSEVNELMQQVGQSQRRSDGARVTVTPAETHPVASQLGSKEAKQEKKLISSIVQQGYEGEVTETPQASADKPVTMIFMGYHSVEDEEETKKLLGFDGTIKAEIVLIDEDDEKSLREKTVTDISTIDGNAADLVSGRPQSDTTELSSEGKDESSTKELPPTGSEKARSVLLTTENGLYPAATIRSSGTLKSAVLPEDDSELKRERSQKTVSFFDSVSVISGKSGMELNAQAETQQSYMNSGQNRVRLDSDVAQEILYLDEVLEANCCETGADKNSNGTYSPKFQAITVDGSKSSVHTCDTSFLHNHEVISERQNMTTVVDDDFNTKPNGHAAMMGSNCTSSPESPMTAIKKEARFELRPFHEEKKPSKLFDIPTEKEVRVKKVRPSEEIAELERERLELIRGQAVKKNPGIATKWWNPPQEKTLEEELQPDKLESLRKYEERKQRRSETNRMIPVGPKETTTFIQPETGNKEDVVMEEIDFSAARKQFLQMEHAKQSASSKRHVAPQLYSAKPFFKTPEVTHVERLCGSVTVVSQEGIITNNESQITTVKAEKIYYCSGESVTPPKDRLAYSESQEDDFTCARAVMTIVKDEDLDLCQRSLNSPYNAEEIDSGLDDLSLRSQDTTVLETLSNDFSMDNISDSGASNETMSAYLENSLGEYSFPPTPMVTTPIYEKHERAIKSPDQQIGFFQEDRLTEEELEYHAGILVQNAIHQAISQQNDKWEPLQVIQQSTLIPGKVESVELQSTQLEEKSTFTQPPKVPSSLEEKTICAQITEVQAAPVITVNTYKPPSLSSSPKESSEFSYFSKYSEAAELRSTAAVTRAQEMEVTSGPFKLRSRKQRTLSMIEEEIRAAQEREEELKRQRQVQALHPPCRQKQKSSNQPSNLVLTGKTAPGKIEKLRTMPPASPCSSDGALPSPLSDLGSDDSSGQRPKNFMETLMEDYETHKVKLREKAEDNCVLEATRVPRRKSNMAIRWEAGIYSNQEQAEEEEAEEEEE